MFLYKRQSEFTLKMNTSQDISLDPYHRLALSLMPAILLFIYINFSCVFTEIHVVFVKLNYPRILQRAPLENQQFRIFDKL